MALTLQYKGFNFVADYSGSYSDASYDDGTTMAGSLSQMISQTSSNAVALTEDWGIDAATSTVYDDLPTEQNYGQTAPDSDVTAVATQAEADGLSVMLRPLIDFTGDATTAMLTAPDGTAYSDGMWRAWYNPAGSQIVVEPGTTTIEPAEVSKVDAFFDSYDQMMVQEAEEATASGAAILDVGTEIDGLTGSAFASYWNTVISDVKAHYSGALTYSAISDDDISPWVTNGDTGKATGLPTGTGDLTTQVSFWSQMTYVGIDEYEPVDSSDPNFTLNPNNPNFTLDPTPQQQATDLQDLIDGWTEAPTDAATAQVTGGLSLIQYYTNVANSLGKPLLFTEIGYGSEPYAAVDPPNIDSATYDPTIQNLLYEAFVDAWEQAEQNGNDVLKGVYIWEWEPDAASVGAGSTATWTPQLNTGALETVQQAFTATNPINAVPETGAASVAGYEGTPTTATGNLLAGDSDSTAGATLSVSAINGSPVTLNQFVDTAYGDIELTANSNGTASYRYFAGGSNTAGSTALQNAPTGTAPVDVIDFTIADSNGATTNQTLSVTDYRDPTAGNESATVEAGQTIAETAGTGGTGALAGDFDPDGASLAVEVINLQQLGAPESNPIAGAYGTLNLNNDGSYSYTADGESALASDFSANNGQPLQDSFTLFVAGPLSTHAQPTTLTIDVTQAASPPPPSAGAAVFWTDPQTGDTGSWVFNSGGDVAGFDDLGSGSTTYTALGAGDFDGNRQLEVLWENTSTGDTGYWQTNGGQVTGFDDLASADTAYSVVGIGDFDAGGHDDVLWEDKSNGDTGFWTTANGTVTGFDDFGSADTAYSVVEVGDFDNSGHDEVLWEDEATGNAGYWLTDRGGQVTGFDDLGAASTAYSVAGIGDFDNSGHAEVLWENKSTGDTGYWTISGGAVTGFHDFGFGSTTYSIIGTGDYDGAGHAEVLWSNPATGDTGYWATSNGAVTGFHDLGAASTSYHTIPLAAG